MIAIISAVSAIIGATLQYLFTRYLDGERHQRERRSQAYADYLKAISEQAQLGNQLYPEAHEILARATDAKCRICLYGPLAVVDAFAGFEQLGATLETPAHRNAFIRMVAAMRSDSGGRGAPTPASIQLILLGPSESTP